MDRMEQQALQAIDQAADGASLASNIAALRNQAAGPRAETRFAMGRESLRLVLSALVCALGLSALSWNTDTQRSQLQAITYGLAKMRQRNQALRKASNPQAPVSRRRNGRWGFGRDQGSKGYINEILRKQERDQT